MNGLNALPPPIHIKAKPPVPKRAEWGVPLFDNQHNGLPSQSFNLLETEDHFSGLLGIARFITTGLNRGENVTLITFGNPETILNRFKKLGYDFHNSIQSERIFVISYKSSFTRAINISSDYETLFAEINYLSKDRTSRLAFLNADLLFNLESYSLAVLSVSKVHEAAKNVNGTILAQFTTVDDLPHQHLRNVSTALINCYLVFKNSGDSKISLEIKVCH